MMQQKILPKIELANTGELVSRIGFGTLGLSDFHTTKSNMTDEEGIQVIGKALSQGLNFFDTAYSYGKNEELVNKAIKIFGRDKFFIATKVPFDISNNGAKENIKAYCYKSLKRLGIKQIDLYYQHRIDQNIPIETQAEAFKELIQEGKIKYYGLSEASEDSIRRAHKIHPVTAVQEEYSLFSRDIENNGVLKACQELGIALVAYSPLGRGVLTGNFQLKSDDYKAVLPRFQKQNLQKNNQLVEQLKDIALELNCTAGQLALGWLLAKGDNIIPIPGTKREKYLTENNEAAQINIPVEVIKKLDQMFPPGIAFGERYPSFAMNSVNVTTIKK